MERGRLADNFSWGQRDIAIVMGKDQSNVSRILRRMKRDARWRAALQSFRIAVGCKERYSDDIFPLILDFCEAEYLERLTHPRRGGILSMPRAQELLEAWRRMRREMERESAGHPPLEK